MNDEVERLERIVARQEDSIFRQSANIIQLVAHIEQLTAGGPRTAEAVAARRSARAAKAAEVQRLTAEGRSIAQIAQRLDISARHVSRLRKG